MKQYRVELLGSATSDLDHVFRYFAELSGQRGKNVAENSQVSDTSISSVTLPTRRWLRRTAWTLLAAFLIATGILIPPRIAFELSKRRLNAAIARYHDRGEPILPADFGHAPIPDDQNAAYFLGEAAGAMHCTREQRAYLWETSITLPLSPENADLLQELFAANTTTLRLAQEANRCSDTDWKLEYRSPVAEQSLPYLVSQRELANLLYGIALYEHHVGNDAAALETVRDVNGIARSLDHQSILVSHLTAIGAGAVATLTARQLALQLSLVEETSARVGSATVTTKKRPATRAQVRSLITELLDEDTFRRGIAESWRGERMASIDLMEFSGRESTGTATVMNRAALQMLPMFDQLEAASLAPTWSAAVQLCPPDPGTSTKEDRLVGVVLPGYLRGVLEEFHSLADRRATASILAVQLYRADHGGTLPTRLEQLAPTYLASVPIDPFAPDGRALSYSLAPQPQIWSVGQTNPNSRFGTARSALLMRESLTFPLTPVVPAAVTTQPHIE